MKVQLSQEIVRGSVSISPGLFSRISSDQIGLVFTLYAEATLLPVRDPANEGSANSTLRTEVGSPIIAATVGAGQQFRDIDPPVVVTLRLGNFSGSVSA